MALLIGASAYAVGTIIDTWRMRRASKHTYAQLQPIHLEALPLEEQQRWPEDEAYLRPRGFEWHGALIDGVSIDGQVSSANVLQIWHDPLAARTVIRVSDYPRLSHSVGGDGQTITLAPNAVPANVYAIVSTTYASGWMLKTSNLAILAVAEQSVETAVFVRDCPLDRLLQIHIFREQVSEGETHTSTSPRLDISGVPWPEAIATHEFVHVQSLLDSGQRFEVSPGVTRNTVRSSLIETLRRSVPVRLLTPRFWRHRAMVRDALELSRDFEPSEIRVDIAKRGEPSTWTTPAATTFRASLSANEPLTFASVSEQA